MGKVIAFPPEFFDDVTPENVDAKRAEVDAYYAALAAKTHREIAEAKRRRDRQDGALVIFLLIGLVINVIGTLGGLDWIGPLFN